MPVASLASSSTSSTSSPFMAIESPDIRSYTEMTKRIPAEDMTKIEEKMENLPSFDSELDRIEGLLETGKYDELPADAFYYVLRGLKEGKTLAKRVARVSDIETLRLQGVNFQVHDLLEFAKDRDTMYRATGRNLSGDRLEAFIKELKELPPEDRFVMVFTPKSPKEKFKAVAQKESFFSDQVTISQIIESRVKVNVFNRIKKQEGYLRMSASLEVYETFLKVRFDNEHAKANPVLGKSTFDQIKVNGLTDTRDICLLYVVPEGNRNKLVTYDKADQFKCEENDFNFHDRYHLFSISCIGSKARKLAATIAQDFKAEFLSGQEKTLSYTDRKAVEQLYSNLVDMEYTSSFSTEKVLLKAVKQGKIPEIPSLEEKILYPYSVTAAINRSAAISQALLIDRMRPFAESPHAYFETQENLEKTFFWIINQIPEDEEYKKRELATRTLLGYEKSIEAQPQSREQIGLLIAFTKQAFSID